MTKQQFKDTIQEILDNHNERGIGWPQKPVEYYAEELKKNLTLSQLTQLHEDINTVEEP
jgi:PhoPQ-activated pathogenicity-related protein